MQSKKCNDINQAISDYFSVLQLKYDCETVYGLIKTIEKDGVTSFGVLPYITLTVATALEMLETNNITDEIIKTAKIEDIRLKLKLFENGYGKSKKMLLNIDYLQNQIFKKQLRFKFMRGWEIHYNLGIYTDENKNVVGNTQYNYYLLQDNRLLKKSLDEVAKSYNVSPDKFDMDEHLGKEAFDYAYECASIINSVREGIKDFNAPINIHSKSNNVKYYYADYNTNKKSYLFPRGEDSKATILYLLHILSTINFLLYVLNYYEEDDYGWWLKVNYVTYYYSVRKLNDLYEHLLQNKLLTSSIRQYFVKLDIKNAKYMNSNFRNYVMHSKFKDSGGVLLISNKYLDESKPLFGLVESCFNGMNYYDLKVAVVAELEKISNVLSEWLNTQSIVISPL